MEKNYLKSKSPSKLVICPHQMVLFGLILYTSFSTATPGQDTRMDEQRTILGSGSRESQDHNVQREDYVYRAPNG